MSVTVDAGTETEARDAFVSKFSRPGLVHSI